MPSALTILSTFLTRHAVEIAISKFIPAIAVGLVAMAHELHRESAVRESARRNEK